MNTSIRKLRRRGCALGAALAFCWAAIAGAASLEQDRFEITADVIEFDATAEVYVAEGNVHINHPAEGRKLDADWVVFSNKSRRGAASGNVVMREGRKRLDADFALFNLDTGEGLLHEGALDSFDPDGTGVRIWAHELVKSGDDTYEFWSGAFTTCRCPDDDDRDPWRVTAGEADLEVGGYGTVRNATFDFFEVPVLWMPWMVFPIKTKRESGLLFPEIAYGNRIGFGIGLPVFFALGDPVNLTITPTYLTKRGFKPNVDLEYVFGKRSRGKMRGSFIYDTDVRDSRRKAKRENEAAIEAGQPPLSTGRAFDPERWAFQFASRTFLPGKWRFNTDLNFVSDNDHPTDFDDLREYRRDRYLPATGFGFRHFLRDGSFGVVGGIQYADDLQSPDDKDRDTFMLQRFPELNGDWLPTQFANLMGLVTAFDSEYISFRSINDPIDSVGNDAVLVADTFFDTGFDGTPDSREGNNRRRNEVGEPLISDPNLDNYLDGSNNVRGGPERDAGLRPGGLQAGFTTGEPLADQGHRIRLHPRIGRPFTLPGGLVLSPEVGYMQNLYITDRDDFEERGVYTSRVDLATRLARSWRNEEKQTEVVHLLEPRLTFWDARRRSQNDNPVFVPPSSVDQRRIRHLEPFNVLDDPADIIETQTVFRFGAANRFYLGRDRKASQLIADVTLSADVDLRAGEFGEIVFDGTTRKLFNVQTRFNLRVDPAAGQIQEGLMDLNYPLPEKTPLAPVLTGGNIGLRYRYLRRIPLFFENFRGNNSDRFENFNEIFTKVNQIDLRARFNFWESWILSGRFAYSLEEDITLDAKGAIDYVSRCKCYAVGLEVSADRNRGLEFQVRYTLVGLGNDARNPFGGGSILGPAGDVSSFFK